MDTTWYLKDGNTVCGDIKAACVVQGCWLIQGKKILSCSLLKENPLAQNAEYNISIPLQNIRFVITKVIT